MLFIGFETGIAFVFIRNVCCDNTMFLKRKVYSHSRNL